MYHNCEVTTVYSCTRHLTVVTSWKFIKSDLQEAAYILNNQQFLQ